jgi:hypothetical protein
MLSGQAVAQKDSLRSIEDEVFSPYKPKLAEAKKIPTKPYIDEPKTLLPEFTYSIPQFRYRVNPVYTPADAIKLKGEKRDDLTGNYFRFGFGNYVTPLAEIHLHNGRHKNYNFGAHVKHFSSNNGTPANADFNDNLINVYGTKKGSKGKLFGSLDYERNGVAYYGYNHDSVEFTKGDVRNVYNGFRGQTNWDNYSDRKKVGINFGLNFGYKTNGPTDEFHVEGSNYTRFKVGQGNLSFNTSYDFQQLKNDSGTLNRNFIRVHPKYAFKQKKLYFELGLRIVDVIDTTNTFRIYPVAHFHHFIVPKKMKFYADVSGDVMRNTFAELSERNPFIAEQYNTVTGFNGFKLEAGIAGLVVKKLDYHMGVSFNQFNNYALFVSDTNITHPFNVVYSGLNRLALHTMLDFNHNEKWFIQLGGNFYSYTAKDADAPWQLPNFDARFSISTVLAKKLRLSVNAFAIGERVQRSVEDPTKQITLETILDLNFNAEYYYKKNLSFFLNANNLTNQKYQYWNFYPQYGINVMAGLTFSI